VLLLGAMALAAAATATERLVFVTHLDPPFTGFLDELLSEALRHHNIDFEIYRQPGRRVITMVNSGKFDGDAARKGDFKVVSNSDTSAYVRVNEPVLKVRLSLVTRKNSSFVAPTWEAVNLGSTIFIRGSKHIRHKITENNRISVETYASMLAMVATKRARIGVGFKSAIENELRNTPTLAGRLQLSARPIESYAMYTYLHRDRSHYRPMLESALRAFKQTADYQKLVQKYGVAAP